MTAVRIMRWVGGLAGLGALALGLTIWFAGIDLRNFHMLFGLLVTLTLLTLGILGVLTSGMRVLGAVSIVYAVIVPIFGVTQFGLLVGNLHWLIQTAHMLVGLGALALMGTLSARYLGIKQATKTTMSSQPTG